MAGPIGAILSKAVEAGEKIQEVEAIKKVTAEAETLATGVWPDVEIEEGAQKLSPMEIGKEAWNGSDAGEIPEKTVEEMAEDYINDLERYSECPETIPKPPFKFDELVKRSPEETKVLRSEFNSNKNRLISEWEKLNGREWPVYEEDILNEYGEIVKAKGWKYDAHHIQSLSLGGANEAKNITPLRYDVHTDHKGVHALDSPYDVLDKRMIKEGMTNE